MGAEHGLSQSSDIGEVWGHGGGDPGVRTLMMFNPENSLGFILFANGSTDLEAFLEGFFDEALK